jgi:hypothetical protein
MRLIPVILLLPAAALAQSAAPPRTLQFSGHEWFVKSSTRPVGPGPNWFSGETEDVWVDARDRLHMRIRNRDGHWWSTEVGTKANLGHGEYRFHLDSNIDALDPNIVLGLFTWDNDPAEAHREIDIEISRWSREKDDNIQFVLQPYKVPGNRLRFMLPPGIERSIHSFTWRQDRISFSIVAVGSETPIRQFSVTENIPKAGRENARINFWLNRGTAPANGKDAEVVFSKFEFVP